ncbi:MarR family transcriptional regulator [Tepidibacter hydrothermalis]|uniref:MarR family transcriptional regulator n=1 Tax=Tepidibacter hydrothermalis TaxID=3036126 RepID=A0ABY8EHL2_9FIRM|nr:MarR family transcriptional regulator [Tepidibacter hydrothermalis]WFD10243.1 MarR family transcriptional regulator [Tepidibacter hydrothermalis]
MNNELMVEKLSETFQMFTEFNDKGFKENYSDLNINEVHAIDYIGRTENANVTKITNHLKITKGGVTKITKKLMLKEYISSYQTEENKKEKYFNLTEKGKEIFEKHKTLHMESIKRDKKIFENFDENEKEVISNFLDILKKDFEEKLNK